MSSTCASIQLGTRSDVCSQYAAASPPTFIDRAEALGHRRAHVRRDQRDDGRRHGREPEHGGGARSTFTSVRQSLPAVDSIEAFLSSHQTSIAQLAIQYCNALVDDRRGNYFPGLNLDGAPNTVFGSNGGKDLLIDPLIAKMIGTNLTTQPSAAELKNPYTPATRRRTVRRVRACTG